MIASKLLNSGSKILKNNKISSHQLDSELLLSNLLKTKREKILTNSNQKISKNIIDNFKKLIIKRSKKEPLAYILKKKNFGAKNLLLIEIL